MKFCFIKLLFHKRVIQSRLIFGIFDHGSLICHFFQLLTKTNSLGSTSPNSQQSQTHHRTKSSPDPLAMQKALNCEGIILQCGLISKMMEMAHKGDKGWQFILLFVVA